MMKLHWKRMIAGVLAAALMIALTPVLPARTAYAVGSYGKVTADATRVRTEPAGSVWLDERLDKGFIVTIRDSAVVDGQTWYAVSFECQRADGSGVQTMNGYIKGDCMYQLSDEEAADLQASGQTASVAAAAQPQTAETEVQAETRAQVQSEAITEELSDTETREGSAAGEVTYIGTVTSSGVNFRETEGGRSQFKLNKGDQVIVLTIPSTIDADHWYYCKSGKYFGYIQAPYLSVTASNGSTVLNNGVTGNVTAPTTSTTGTYVKLILSSANLRDAPDGRKQEEWTATGSVLPVNGMAVVRGEYTWYPVTYNNRDYYVRGDCVQLVDKNGQPVGATAAPSAAPTATPAPGTEVTPAPATAAPTTVPAGTLYVTLSLSSANLRETPGGRKIGEWTRTGETIAVNGQPDVSGGYTWYPIRVNGMNCYVRNDCVTVSGKPNDADTNNTSQYGYVKTTRSGVNIRQTPAGNYLEQVDKNVILPLLTNTVSNAGGYNWYCVKHNGTNGYVRSDCVVTCDANGNETSQPTSAPATEQPTGDYGQLKLTKDSVNLRKTPGGDVLDRLNKGTVLTIIGAQTTSGRYKWYPVRSAAGEYGYIRSDCGTVVQGGTVVTNTPDPNATATPAPTATAENVLGYVRITKSATNFRKTPGGNKIAALDKNSVYPIIGASTTQGGYTWYNIRANGLDGWVRDDCITETNQNGTSGTTTTGRYLKTTTNNVNLRTAASKDAAVGYNIATAGTVMGYMTTKTVGGVKWYNVVYNNTSLWVQSSCVATITQAEYDAYMLANPQSTVETEVIAGYIKVTTSGTNVRSQPNGNNILGRLEKDILLPYASITTLGKYAWYYCRTSYGFGYIRGDCVQQCDANGNAVTPSTPNNDDPNNLTMAIYPAEKIDWYTGGIQTLWPKGTNVKVYDVKTGIVWWAHRWSGGYHADVETLTAADSARFAKMYGVSSTDQIAKKNLWQRRPSLITIGDRTFACSLYGIPHNYPEGDTISNNDMKGQVCIHFTNSKTHTGNQVDSYHTKAIQEAWENAPNGHK